MAATFQNSAMVLSIGVFFSLMVLGLAASLPAHLYAGLTSAGVPAADATRISHLPPVGLLFAAFLGDNPVRVLLGPTIHHLSAAHAQLLTSRSFFPALISAPFESGLRQAFDFAGAACLVAAAASWLSGERYVHGEPVTKPVVSERAEPGEVVVLDLSVPEEQPETEPETEPEKVRAQALASVGGSRITSEASARAAAGPLDAAPESAS